MRQIYKYRRWWVGYELVTVESPRRRSSQPITTQQINWLVSTLSLPIPLRLYTLPYWSNPPFLIFDIRALWHSGLSASARLSKILNGGLDQYGAKPFKQQRFGTAGVEWVNKPNVGWLQLNYNNSYKKQLLHANKPNAVKLKPGSGALYAIPPRNRWWWGRGRFVFTVSVSLFSLLLTSLISFWSALFTKLIGRKQEKE